jgi:hypothetical protein
MEQLKATLLDCVALRSVSVSRRRDPLGVSFSLGASNVR